MKKVLLSLFIGFVSMGFVAADAEARRLGGGLSQGLKRPAAPQKAPDAPAQKQATPTNAAAAAPAAAAKRSWLGPIAGLAAGLGLVALMSHLGLGEELANFVMLALLVMVAVIAIRFLMRKFAPAAQPARGMQFAGAGAPRFDPASVGAGAAPAASVQPQTQWAAAPQGGLASLPAGFDTAAFERAAKMIFIRMQAANDEGNLEDLRHFATPEMFAAFRLDIQDRKGATQRTDVVQLDAEVVDFAEEDGQQIVSVRYRGLIREEGDAPATPFDEVWHLVKPLDGSREWAIAGIMQTA
ncbi:Tim44 domain-containing protein [Piscinibacter sp.]|uniref:Tim44 domain-containing protein n=1 Tax=Piscinibacter sp. TaxID=1903157 RepID=UPI002BC5A590|nr:TIM44-like domain-containing protein [Albitalea sp.]HUG23560.1 TIM44-like domain-containing protein [Albitalea sp.]